MLHVAIPKGRLFEGVCALLAKAGYPLTFPHPRALLSDPVNGIQGQLVKPRAIPQLVHHGCMDIGFTGLDLLTDADYPDLEAVLDLGGRPVDIVVAASSRVKDVLTHPPARPLFIATEYPNIASRWALAHGFSHIVHQTYGSTEGYGGRIADLVVDCVETGATMVDNDLVPLETILRSTTHLIARRPVSPGSSRAALQQFIEAIRSQEKKS